MRIQTLTGIFPTERPRDPENGNPGTVGTVTGAEVQSVLLCPEIVARGSPTTPARPAAPTRIVIEPTASGRKWIARLGDRVLCVTAWPFVMSARLLLAEGFPADTVIEMWRPNSDEWALRGRLEAVAATVIDGETAPRCAKNGPPDRAPEQDGHMRAPPGCARPGAVSGWTMTPSNGATLLGVDDRTHCDTKRFVAKPSPAGEQA
jgi:hypothetical protein